MVWSGVFYIILLSIGFVAYRLLAHDVTRSITPGYWAPPTLFNLGQITHGYGIEDALFMFFGGGIASVLYEFITRKKLGESGLPKPKKRVALGIGILGALIFHALFYLNDMYVLIAFNLFGAMALLWFRRDLLAHSLISGVAFMVVYILAFMLFNSVFPDFINQYYNLLATSGLSPLGVPLEEYLYGITFGMLWGPLYAFAHGLKASKRYVPAGSLAK